MSTQPVAGVKLKFARARKHAADRTAAIGDYLNDEPFRLVEDDDSVTGDLVTRVNIVTEPPVELSGVIGDVVHNTRSAMDYLAWQLVLANHRSPDRSTQFPSGSSRANFQKNVKRCLDGASEAAREEVERLAVYPGGTGVLWLVHQLDIEDKHKLLIPVGMLCQSVNLHLAFGDAFGAELGAVPPLPIMPADNGYPLSDGAEVFRVMKAARQSDPGFLSGVSYTFTLGFGTESLVAGKPILPTIVDLVDDVERQLQPLVDLL